MRKEQENQNLKRNQITQKILDMDDFPLPQQAVEEESKAIFQNRIELPGRELNLRRSRKTEMNGGRNPKRRGKLGLN